MHQNCFAESSNAQSNRDTDDVLQNTDLNQEPSADVFTDESLLYFFFIHVEKNFINNDLDRAVIVSHV